MVAGGIVFRLVTPHRPGEPSLDDSAAAFQIRTEYYCGGTPPWTLNRDEAQFFATHLEADHFAQSLGGLNAGIHAKVATPFDDELIPERLKPVHELAPALAEPRELAPKRKKRVARPAIPPVPARESWVTKAYG